MCHIGFLTCDCYTTVKTFSARRNVKLKITFINENWENMLSVWRPHITDLDIFRIIITYRNKPDSINLAKKTQFHVYKNQLYINKAHSH